MSAVVNSANRTELIEAVRHARSLTIDNGKALEAVRDLCFITGDHHAMAKVADGKHVLVGLVKLFNDLLATESEMGEEKR